MLLYFDLLTNGRKKGAKRKRRQFCFCLWPIFGSDEKEMTKLTSADRNNNNKQKTKHS